MVRTLRTRVLYTYTCAEPWYSSSSVEIKMMRAEHGIHQGCGGGSTTVRDGCMVGEEEEEEEGAWCMVRWAKQLQASAAQPPRPRVSGPRERD